MNVVSLFAGIGGFDLAFERAGATVSLQSEIDKHASGVLVRHFPACSIIPDVKDIRLDDISALNPADTALVGGFPCQDISVAGKRAGLAGERSGLFYEYVRVAAALTPAWLVIENVPGLLSSNGGRDMGAVLGALAQLGYGFSYRVLDAQHFGVPQRRRRVFIVGHLGDWRRAAEVLFERESGDGNPAPGGTPGADVARSVAVGVTSTLQGGGQRGYRVDAEAAAGRQLVVGFAHTQGLDAQPSETAWPTLRREGNGHAVAVPLALRGRDGGAQIEAGEDGEPYNALRGSDGGASRHSLIGTGEREVSLVRRLLPVECERLQGFPDGWTEGQSDAQRYRQLGNAVAVPVVEWIARRMMQETAE